MTDNKNEFDKVVTDALNEGAVLVNCGVIYRGDINGTSRYTHWAHLVSPELAEQVKFTG